MTASLLLFTQLLQVQRLRPPRFHKGAQAKWGEGVQGLPGVVLLDAPWARRLNSYESQ